MGQGKINPNNVEAFLSRVDVQGPWDCWEWQGCTINGGYGQCKRAGRLFLAHRLSYENSIGSIPEGLDVLHLCDNPRCVNPAHLALGTHQDNMTDMVRKKRSSTALTGRPTKLTLDQVIEIRKRYRKGIVGTPRLAREYGIAETTVRNILSGKQWKQ